MLYVCRCDQIYIKMSTKSWPCIYNLFTLLSTTTMSIWSIFELSLYCKHRTIGKKGKDRIRRKKNYEAKRSLWGRGSRLAIWCVFILLCVRIQLLRRARKIVHYIVLKSCSYFANRKNRVCSWCYLPVLCEQNSD